MKVNKKDLENVIEILQNCVDEMDANEVNEISTSCNTYKMYKFISFGSSGYLSLDNGYIEVDSGDEDE